MSVTEEAFYEIVRDTWTSTLGFQVDRAETEEFSEIGALTVCVKVTGAWDGELRLRCSAPLARFIAAAIFQVEADAAGGDEILDALSELVHIVGGNLKTFLPQPVTLSLPSVPDLTGGAPSTRQPRMIHRLGLISEGQPFIVDLWEDFPAAEKENTPPTNERRCVTG